MVEEGGCLGSVDELAKAADANALPSLVFGTRDVARMPESSR